MDVIFHIYDFCNYLRRGLESGCGSPHPPPRTVIVLTSQVQVRVGNRYGEEYNRKKLNLVRRKKTTGKRNRKNWQQRGRPGDPDKSK